jgi:hypothetical protein
MKCGLNQILKRQTSRSHYGSKAPAVAITVSKYRNKTGKTAVKAVPCPAKQTLKTLLRHTLIRKIFLTFFLTSLPLYIFIIIRNAPVFYKLYKCIIYIDDSTENERLQL